MAAPPAVAARVDDQGDSSTCTRFALAKAVVECLDDLGINIRQTDICAHLVNQQTTTVYIGKWPTDFDKTSMRFQDPTSTTGAWHFLTMAVKESSPDDFKAAAIHKISSSFLAGLTGFAPKALCTKGTKFVVNWTTSPGKSHCVYAKGWDRQEGTVFCLNSWGKYDREPHISPGSISCYYSVSVVVQASEGGLIEAMSAFPGLELCKMTEEALQMCTDLGVTFPEEPLSSPQSDFTPSWDGNTISKGLLVHKMAAEGEVSSLRRRRAELTPAIINSRCQRFYHSPPIYYEVTPLYLACINKHWALAALLMEEGAEPNIAATMTSDFGTFQNLPLNWAARGGDFQTVVALVKGGARNSLGLLELRDLTYEIRDYLRKNPN